MSWNKGLTKETDERVEKYAKKAQGRFLSVEQKQNSSKSHQGQIPWNKGKKNCFSEETRIQISSSKKGQQAWNKGLTKETDERVRKISNTLIGHKVTEETKQKLRNQFAPQLNFRNTSIEIKLQAALIEMGIRFETHKSIVGIPDIFISPNICVFVDGEWWHADPRKFNVDDLMYVDGSRRLTAQEVWKKDFQITNALIQQGYIVLRFWEYEINNDIKSCVKKINEVVFI